VTGALDDAFAEMVYREMTESVTKMLKAELAFDELRRLYKTHRQYAGLDEASQETRHAADPRTKQAIAQCAFFRERASMFAAVYQAWDVRQQRSVEPGPE